MNELTFKLVELLILAGLLALLGGFGVALFYRRRNPALYRTARPPISRAMEHDLLGRDNDVTRDILMGTPYHRGRPMYAQPGPPAIEAAPRAIEAGRP